METDTVYDGRGEGYGYLFVEAHLHVVSVATVGLIQLAGALDECDLGSGLEDVTCVAACA